MDAGHRQRGRVVPVLIAQGEYVWPWLGVNGRDVNLLIARANDLATQRGAYIDAVTEAGPAAEAGLQGSTGATRVGGVSVPLGGISLSRWMELES